MLRIEKYIEEVFMTAIHKLYPDKELKPIEISIATNEKFGDFQTNFAMMNSKIIGGNPRKIAEEIVNEIGTCNHLIEKLEIAGPGFINIFLKDEYLGEYVSKMTTEKFEYTELNTKGDVIIDYSSPNIAKREYLGEYVSKMTTEKFEYTELNTKGDVIIDYSSPNIAKRMHIGHLRSTIIGDAVKRLYNFLGYHTVADNHIGDWGTQFGKLIIGYRKWLDKEAYEKNPIEELERVYVEFSKESENDPSLDDLAREELKKLQDGDKENYALWQEFIKVSLDEYNKLYNRMGITFDTYYGESFYHNMMPAVLDELVEKGLAVEDQGAKVVFFDEKDNLHPCIVQKKDGAFYHNMMPAVLDELVEKGLAVEDQGAKVVFFDEKDNLHPCIVQKKDGAFLYSTSDIATVKFRKENYDINRLIYLTDERQQEDNLHPCIVQKKDGAFLYSTSDIATVKFRKENYDINRLIYLTDERQQDHFKQFFKITEMLGWDIEKIHIWFGIMRFADGVFSTRKGNVIRLEQLLDEGKKRALEVIEEKNPSLSDEEKNNIAEVVGVGAIKYADLSQNRQSPIIFEWDKVLSFEGNTAPYLQYSYARIQSIKKKAEEMGKVITYARIQSIKKKAEEMGKVITSDTKIVIKDKIERNLVTFLTLFPTMVLKAARIQSIKKKAEEMGKVITSDTKIVIKDKIERNLVTFLTLFPTMVLKAGETYKPNLLTDYLFDLAKKFNTFYNACPILNQEDEVLLSRLLIADRTAEILRQGLDLLGIRTVDRM